MSINLSNINTHSKPNQELPSILISSNIITTPCEKVLSILREAKNFIFNYSKENKLIQKLEWVIKKITSRSLYSYELKEKETINKLTKVNPEFKQLVDFVSEYNEKVIKMNRKYNYILTDKLLQKPSTKLNRKRFERRASFGLKNSNFLNLLKLEEINEEENKNDKKVVNTNNFINNNKKKNIDNIISNTNISSSAKTNKNKNDLFAINKHTKTKTSSFENNMKRKLNQKKNKKKMVNINDIDDDERNNNNSQEESNENFTFFNNSVNYTTHKSANIGEDVIKKLNLDKKSKIRYSLFP